MDMQVGPLSRRTVSAYPLSIGTSLSFESIAGGPNPPYDPERQIPDRVDLSKYQLMAINVTTLYRNIVGALAKEDHVLAQPVEIVEAMQFEIDVIKDIVKENSNGQCQTLFYSCTYDKQYRHQRQKAVQLRRDKTDLQLLASAKLNQTIGIFHKHHDKVEYPQFDDEIKFTKRQKVLLLSHFPYDLLSYKNTSRMDLLESHTGKLKPRPLWYTKYHKVPGHELNTLPFTEKLLKIFGDGPMFVPMDIRFRKLILDISVAQKWSPLTTEAKMQYDLDRHIKERYLYDVYMSI